MRCCVAALVVAVSLGSVLAVAPDQALTKELEEALRGDDFVISVNNIRPRKRRGPETLLAAEFTGSKEKFIVILDRRTRHVNIETVHEGKAHVERYTVKDLDESTAVKNIFLHVHQTQPDAHVDLYLNCTHQGVVPLATTFKDMAGRSHTVRLEVYKDKKHKAKVWSGLGISDVLERENCPSNFPDVDGMQGMQPSIENEIRRGDISIADLDDKLCMTDALLAKTINELIQAVRQVSREVELNKIETRQLRQLIENCAGCRPQPPAPPCQISLRPSCKHDSPCFPGAQCRDTAGGPECLSCPQGYVGDGRTCVRGYTCADNRCFPGTRCTDTATGYKCGPCPAGYVGNGERCERRGGCSLNPCHSRVRCISTDYAPYYRCGSCPVGFTGNGTDCRDIDECDLETPCDPRVRCLNLSPGYRCDPCPPGFEGRAVQGNGPEDARRNKQRCVDINECNDGRNGGCDPNSECINEEGGFRCSSCRPGYEGNPSTGCRLRPGLCPDGVVSCDENAGCVHIGHNNYKCRVN